MIVRNEAEVISRCLVSVKPFISHWTICDTGSSDQTAREVQTQLVGIPGKLYNDQWVNFGHNRTLAMERSRRTADYHLLLDADMVLHATSAAFAKLTADAYLIPFTGLLDYSVIRLVSDQHDWAFQGSTHEFIHSPTAGMPCKMAGVAIEHLEDGGSRNGKYARDIELLSTELVADPGNPRTVFYLAQSYRDAGRLEEALANYEKRALMEGWVEERWYALLQIGRMQEALEYDWRVVLNSYLQAYEFRPSRLESVFRIAQFYRSNRQWALGYHFSRLILEIGYPDDILFVQRAVYEYLLAHEYALCCYHTGRGDETRRILEILLQKPVVPSQIIQDLMCLSSHR